MGSCGGGLRACGFGGVCIMGEILENSHRNVGSS